VENWEKTFPQGEFPETLSWRQVSTDLGSGRSSRSHPILAADGRVHFRRISHASSHSKTLVSKEVLSVAVKSNLVADN
jgi:hypothetical protein